jgi:KRAB domain-containing zinc finger protein
MFSHLTLLNQHKRSHNTEDGHQTDSGAITVVTQQPGIIQAQNIISESGQNLGQIQIVATESLEPATQTIQHTNNEVTMIQTSTKDKNQKCISCNGPITGNIKRKGPKLIRCENCINGDNNVQSIRPTQIFVAPDGDIKFEIGEITQDQLGQNIIPITQVSSLPNNIQVQAAQPQKTPKKKSTQSTIVQPIAQATNVTTVIKCTKCNGTGVIVLNNANSTTTSTANSNTSTTGTIVSTSPGKTTQIVQLQTQPQIQQQTQQIQQIQIQHQPVQQQQQQQQTQQQTTTQASPMPPPQK